MEVVITSKQIIKPSSSKLHLLKPFKLSLLDQLMVPSYTPVILFYTKPSDSQIDGSQASDQLKQGLSKALTLFYPIAGRLKNNLVVSDYNEGVPFVDARVKGRLSDIMDRTGELDQEVKQLLPLQPFRSVGVQTVPLLAVQCNIFDCGGIAIGISAFHKVMDAMTSVAFSKCLTAFSRRPNAEIPSFHPDLLGAGSRFFPPVERYADLKGLLLNESMYYQEGRFKTRSFVFDSNAIATLKMKAKSKNFENPSRIVALTAFLWKHAILASISASGSPKLVYLRQLTNIRPKMKPQMADYSIGNLFVSPITSYNPVPVGKDIELTELAYLVTEAVKSVGNNSHEVLQGYKSTTERLKQIAQTIPKGGIEFLTVSSWLNIMEYGRDDLGRTKSTSFNDFGWGNSNSFIIPGVDTGITTKFNRLIFLKFARQPNAIEAVITLFEKEIDFLERDPEFLAFASPTSNFGKIKM